MKTDNTLKQISRTGMILIIIGCAMFFRSCGHITGTSVERVTVIDAAGSTVTIRRPNGQEREAYPPKHDDTIFKPGDSATWIVEWDLPYDLLGGVAGWSKYYFRRASGTIIVMGMAMALIASSVRLALKKRTNIKEIIEPEP